MISWEAIMKVNEIGMNMQIFLSCTYNFFFYFVFFFVYFLFTHDFYPYPQPTTHV